MDQKKKPQVIFLDAVGTIFGVKDSVGEAYVKIYALPLSLEIFV